MIDNKGKSCHLAVEMYNVPDLNVQFRVILKVIPMPDDEGQTSCTLQTPIISYTLVINVGQIQVKCGAYYITAQRQYRRVQNGLVHEYTKAV